jgi:hypothetical protein
MDAGRTLWIAPEGPTHNADGEHPATYHQDVSPHCALRLALERTNRAKPVCAEVVVLENKAEDCVALWASFRVDYQHPQPAVAPCRPEAQSAGDLLSVPASL